MAEILRQGKLPTDKWFQAVCLNCNTHFKFQKKEIQTKGDQRDGYYDCIKCPFCTQDVREPMRGGFENYVDERVKKPAQIDGPWNVTR